MKYLLIALILALIAIPAHAETFIGDSFEIDLPNIPSQVQYIDIPGPDGIKASVGMYEGKYEIEDVVIDYAIRTAIVPKKVFNSTSEEEMMNQIIEAHMNSGNTLQGVGDLHDKITLGGCGQDIYYKNPSGYYVFRVIVTKPRIWVMVIHYTKNTKKEAKLVLKMLTSFRITKVDKSCMLYDGGKEWTDRIFMQN